MGQPIQKIDFHLSDSEWTQIHSALTTSQRWNQESARTRDPRSPHREADDVWCRFGSLNDPALRANQPFQCHWYYPELTPIIEPVVNRLVDHVGGTELGGVLVTRIPPGQQVYPHIDQGWHAGYFSKFCVCVAADPDQVFAFDDAELRSVSKDVFWFRNDQKHWVINNSTQPRISMICCIRTPRGPLEP